MTCREVAEVLHDYVSGELDDSENGEIFRHLQNCESCRAKARQMQELRTRIRDLLRTPAPGHLRARVLSLRSE
ncbi:zf-HC2 domain-containing protein [Candidatus Fermentibacterales bacterium]|nr:zf-HC2 domain-containing protein [Candidatus Fermentibacterales bacterium]